MVDLAGLDIGWRKRKSLAATRDPKRRYSPVNDRLCELGRFGQKTGAGWYRYEKGSRAPILDPLVADIAAASAREQGIARRTISPQEILERCLYPLVNEGARILDEGIAARPGDVDTVWINGYAFPAWKGGPMFWAERIGLANVLASTRAYARDHDGWEAAPLLERVAVSGGRWPA